MLEDAWLLPCNQIRQTESGLQSVSGDGMNKYNNKKITRNGITYDSIKEYRRHLDLIFLEKTGKIKDLKRQVKFVLIPSQKVDGKVVERPVTYIADFVYENEKGRVVVEDTKGVKTKDYIIKRKLMLWVHGIRIQEV